MRTLAKFCFLCLLPAVSACVALPSEGDAPGGESILTAFLEGGELTKTHFAGPEEGVYYPYWSGNELIAVYSDNSSDPARFALKSGQNSRKATFAGPVSGRRYIALYPFENGGKHNEGSVSLTLTAVQNYKKGSFGEGAFPMLAVSSSNSLYFKNLCAVLKVSVTGRYTVQSITFIANDEGMAVSGQASVSTSNPEAPALVMEGGGSPKVQLVVPEVKLSEQTATDFYIVVPPGTYKRGITLKIKTSEGTVTRSTDTDLVFKRSELRAIPAFECSGAQVDPTDLPDNTIWYKTENGQPINIRTYAFASPIVSHTYKDGRGEIVLREGITTISAEAFSGKPVGNQDCAHVSYDRLRVSLAFAAVGIEGDREGVLFPDGVEIHILIKADSLAVLKIRRSCVGIEGPAEDQIVLADERIRFKGHAVRVEGNVLRYGLVGIEIGVEGQGVVILLPQRKEFQIILAGDRIPVIKYLYSIGAFRPADEDVALAGEGVQIQRSGNVRRNDLGLHGALAAVGVEGHGVGSRQLVPNSVESDTIGIKFICRIDQITRKTRYVIHCAERIL